MNGADPFDFPYPLCKPHASGWLDVGDGHRIWWEETGDPAGEPVLLLHGGPGAPAPVTHRRFFDPAFYRLITFHQRGCGRSTPAGETRENDTQALIHDIERLRAKRGVDRWKIVGGSWGTCLAMLYGQAHPDRCRGFVLAGVALGRDADRDWWWGGTGRIYPEAYAALLAHLPPELRSDPVHGYHRLLMDERATVNEEAAYQLCLFSARTTDRVADPARMLELRDPALSLPLARLFVHYVVNRWFLRPDQVLGELGRIVHLPCAIVNGRLDVTTPAENAWLLHEAWPGSTLDIVPDAAHRTTHPGLARAFLDAIETAKSWENFSP